MADNFYYVEGSATVKDIILGMATEFAVKANKGVDDDHSWDIVYPAGCIVDNNKKEITNGEIIKNELILSTRPSFLGDADDVNNPHKDKKFYLRFTKDSTALTSMKMQIGEKVRAIDPHILVYMGAIPTIEDPADYMPPIKVETYLDKTAAVIDTATSLVGQDIECTAIFPKKVGVKSLELWKYNENTGELEGTDAVATLSHSTHYTYSGNDYIIDASSLADLKTANTLNDGTFAVVFVCELVGKELDPAHSGPITKMAWYTGGKLDTFVGDWLPVQYWMNITPDCVNMVLRGDPSVDVYPYDSYIMSYAYIGGIKKIADDPCAPDANGYHPEDILGNFGLTCSSDTEPTFSRKFGLRTGTGITDIMMAKTRSGMPYQAHFPAYYATTNFLDKMNLEGSRWNDNKHQFSEMTLVHSVDMERGKLQNVLIGDGSSITNLDKLAYKRGTSDEEMYRKFTITAPYWLMNNGTNNLYSVAIRCYRDYVETP